MATALNVEPSLSTRRYSSSSSSTSSSANGLPTDAQASDDGWEDAEPDEEQVSIVSLFDDEVFPDVKSLLEHCRQKYDFDLLRVRKELDLDFYGTVKLVNYLRSEVKRGNEKPDVSRRALFEDEQYLQPVLRDDALLFCLDELDTLETEDSSGVMTNGVDKGKGRDDNNAAAAAFARISELEEELRRVQSQYAEYRLAVGKILDERWEEREPAAGSSSSEAAAGQGKLKDNDSHYFESYSYNDIHETMLKDTIRTTSYRNFIYTHKPFFKDRVVLDIGAGTGILSLFCARAGAARVIAVDNSSIIDKCRANVFENGLSDKITCLHGKIEEVIFPPSIEKVDIIVSEWMGYCLLYEAMLDSVLWARDRYLKEGGLMVPSCVTIRMAPVADPEYVAENIAFWHDVYGFKMSAMMENIHDDVLIRHLSTDNLAASSTEIVCFDLHTVTVVDLTFRKPFQVVLDKDIDALDGWVIWFDTFFLTSCDTDLPTDAKAEEWKGDGVAFTTGPGGAETHWKSGVMLIDRGKRRASPLSKGQVIKGEVAYRKHADNERELDIEISWVAEGAEEKGRQDSFNVEWEDTRCCKGRFDPEEAPRTPVTERQILEQAYFLRNCTPGTQQRAFTDALRKVASLKASNVLLDTRCTELFKAQKEKPLKEKEKKIKGGRVLRLEDAIQQLEAAQQAKEAKKNKPKSARALKAEATKARKKAEREALS